jgi:hypothetical protein
MFRPWGLVCDRACNQQGHREDARIHPDSQECQGPLFPLLSDNRLVALFGCALWVQP